MTEPVAGRVAESGAGAELGAIRLRAYGRADGALSSATAATAASRAVHPSHPSPGTVRSRWMPVEVYVVGAFDDPEPFEPEVHHLIPRKPE